jgi:hypothetical protein
MGRARFDMRAYAMAYAASMLDKAGELDIEKKDHGLRHGSQYVSAYMSRLAR